MSKVVVVSFITLDGVIQGPGGPEEDIYGGFRYGGWVVPYFDDLLGSIMDEQMKQPFSLLLGRKTYEIFASYWPQHEADWPGVNDATKYVVSRTLTSPGWKHSVLIADNVVDEIRKLKEQDIPDLQIYGSSQLIHTLLQHELIDELWLKTFPIVLGTGKRLWANDAIPAAFRLTDAKISPKGVIVANYERAGEVQTGSFMD